MVNAQYSGTLLSGWKFSSSCFSCCLGLVSCTLGLANLPPFVKRVQNNRERFSASSHTWWNPHLEFSQLVYSADLELPSIFWPHGKKKSVRFSHDVFLGRNGPVHIRRHLSTLLLRKQTGLPCKHHRPKVKSTLTLTTCADGIWM